MSAGRLAAKVSTERLWQRHEALAKLGATAAGGVNRQALSDNDIAARRQMIAWGNALGLQALHDPAGNFFLRKEGTNPKAPPVLCGSHLDSQPTGGKYDGVYGVLAALEAIQVMTELGIQTPRPIEVVAWMNEEGSRFAPGMMGSEAFADVRPLDTIKAVRDAEGVSVASELDRLFKAFPDVPVRPLGFPVSSYLEAHIEQGPVLDSAGIPLGIVSGIQGKKTFRVEVVGEEGHAGTTPRLVRRDALRSAAAMIHALHTAIVDQDDVVRFTVGRVIVEPNAPSVIPAKVTFSIDLRHPDAHALNAFGDIVTATCMEHAEPCQVKVALLVDAPPLVFPDAIKESIRRTSEELGIANLALASAAGHDARNLHYRCLAGMIFVPCKDGLSHNEAEAAQPRDLADGARVLVEVVHELACKT